MNPPTAIRRGFTLIELMIAVAIIGILAALSVPNFIKYQARSKQSEVKSNLKALFVAQKSYYGEKAIFVDQLDLVGFSPERANRYAYFGGGGGTEDRKASLLTNTTAASTNCPTLAGVGYIAADNYKYGAGAAIGAAADPGPGVAATMLATGTANPSGASAVTAPGIFNAKGADTTCCGDGICDFEASAAGNIDNDFAWDGWIVTSQSGAKGTTAACAAAKTITSTQYDVFADGEPVNVCNDLTLY
jgi:type IV pilus assembly protein PilA